MNIEFPDYPFDIGMSRRELQALADKRLVLLKEIESELAWCPKCWGVEPSTGGGIEHFDDCELAEAIDAA